MKQISLFLIALLLSFSSNAQLAEESFESWTNGQGPANWKVLQNTIGTANMWVQSTAGFAPTPPHTGMHAAYMDAQNVTTGLPEDYLVTPLFNAPVNGRLFFYSRLTQALDQGSVYKVKILPTGANADDLTAYVELQSWTELQINPTQTEYNKITVDIPAEYENTNVRLAFVLVSDNGDRWLIDDVKVVSQCLLPVNLTASDITINSANLTWDNPSGAAQWEIEIVEEGQGATGTGFVYSGALPYHAAGLQSGMEYRFYVRALCADSGESDWTDPAVFTTVQPGDSCQDPIQILSLPYTANDDTANYPDTYEGSAGGCGVSNSAQYLNGNDVTYAYTATANGTISINVANITDTYAGIFVYTSCAAIGTQCYAGAANDYLTPAPDLNIPSISVTAGTTYYIVISSWFAESVGYQLNIQEEFCEKPTNLAVTDPTYTGATFSWDSTATSWQYVIQPVGTGLPMGAGLATNFSTITSSTLSASTQYEIYVRSNCGDGTFSSWTGPVQFNTLCNNFTTPYFEGFNTDSASQFCWTIADINNDGSVWDMDFTYDSFEGDQSAKFDVSATSENDDMLISPAIVLTGNERLKFRYKTQEFGAVAFKVMASTTGNAPEDFTIELSPLTSYAVDLFTEKIINVSNLPAGPVHFAWYVPTGVNGGYELMIDNIIVEPMPACAEPTDIVVTNIGNTTANVTWTAGNTETNWEIIVGNAQTVGTPGASTNGTPVTATSYTATGLVPNTLQSVFVRAICGPNNKSIWTGPYYFTTKCDALPVPFFEGFNSDSATEQCWTTANNNGDWAVWDLANNDAFEGDEAANMYAGNAANNDWLISPAINLTGNERLKFHYKIGNAQEGSTGFKVLLSTTNANISDFTEVIVPETVYTNEEYVVKTVSLAAYTGTVYIAWQVPPTVEYASDLFIDNVIIEPLPACPEPSYIEFSDVTQTSALVNWTPGGNETQWELFINVDGEDAPATGITVTSLPYTITDLADGSAIQSGTPYHVTVKAICSDTSSSIPSDGANFVTLISNDDCETAVTIPVNTGAFCELYANGTLNLATESPQANPCGEWTSADDDVWFEFTATSPTHTVTVFDISEGASYMNYVIYNGDDCDNLTQIGDCNGAYAEFGNAASTTLLENLTVGSKYKLRIFSAEASTNQTTTFKICVKVPVKPIIVSTTEHTVEELVKNVLFNGNCSQISNVTYSTGTNYPDPDNIFGDNPNGIGYFNKGESSFPFNEGIVMTTGDVLKVPGPNYRAMEQGSGVWLGDTDVDAVMENMLGAPPFQPSTNASVIEFDFVPSVPQLNLDFFFASEEYGDMIQCYSYDTFAVLLTDADGNTQNIAVIPGTDLAISVFNISGAGYPNVCPGYNLEWFDKYNVFGQEDLSPTSFAGQTKVMTATANVQVNQQYHLKIAIAETDNNLDSGVFIKGGIIDGGGTVDLGDDMLVASQTAVCDGESATIATNLDAAVYDFEWKRNDVVIAGQTDAALTVTEPGTYSVSANITGYTCLIQDSVVVEFYPADATANPADITVCDVDGFADFDLVSNTAVILSGLNPANYTVTYYADANDAENNANPLLSPYTNTVQFTQTVYARIVNNTTQCLIVKSFVLNAQDLSPQFTLDGIFTACSPEDTSITVSPSNFNLADATYTWTLNGAPIAANTSTIVPGGFGEYAITVAINDNCSATDSVVISRDETAFEIAVTDNCENNIYVVEVIDNGGFNIDTAAYAWTGPEGFTSQERKFTATLPGIYNVVVTTADGCIGKTEFTVTSTTCEIPRGISPNGDGKNDELDLSTLSIKKLSIFNRYGQEVFTKNNYTKEWHGQDSHGSELPTGTYFYMIELQGESKTGWIYVNRQE